MIRIEVLTLFPELFAGFTSSSLIKRAQQRALLDLNFSNIRDFAAPPHQQVDDTPYGGGAGMLMKPEPLAAAIENAKSRLPTAKTILLSPAGRLFNQSVAEELCPVQQLILVCGRYEGVDQRVIDLLIDEEISIGDYVLMGGEVPAMVVIEAVLRLKTEVLGNCESIKDESFAPTATGERLLEAPQYTRPPEFRGLAVPPVLLSGNHKEIKDWRLAQARIATQKKRPDLL
ncbi:MAG: tRNA (guanosine(37)-N1)-methyltransferase TrmD [Deltaproteobacteria bacterium]|nr:tRNA (guanosine(37)-N1)-methyltransferase TrmD [Deltaproteobacteria bacterium]